MFFLVDFVFAAGAIAAGGFGVVYLIKDQRRGFIGVKSLGARFSGLTDRILKGPPSAQRKAEALLAAYASQVDGLREGVARLKANATQSQRIAMEETEAAKEARKIAEDSLRRGDESVAEQAIVLALNAEERARLHSDNVDKYTKLAGVMISELDNAESELENVKTSVDTIRVHSEINSMNRELYEILSEVSKQSGGFTAKGELQVLVEQTERDALTSSEKIGLVKQSSISKKAALGRITKDFRVEQELDKARNRISLNGGYDPSDDADESQAEDSISVMMNSK